MSFEYKLHINYIIFLSIYVLTFYTIYRKVQDYAVSVHLEKIKKLDILVQSVNEDANVSASRSNLPEISYGMNCVYGKQYKMDCNTCRCGHRNTLLCTKAACLGPMNFEVIDDDKADNGDARNGEAKNEDATLNGIERKRRRRKIKRRGNRKTLRNDQGQYPKLPLGSSCIPGRFYQENCKRCFCNADRIPICSILDACKEKNRNPVSKPEDVRPPVKDKEFKGLQALPHSAAPCDPGNTYKIDCNVCICDEQQNLICDKMLCISFSDMHKTEAMKRSGLPCNTNNAIENEAIQSKCVKCVCNVTTFCQAIEDCVSDSEKATRTYSGRRNGSRLAFDLDKQKCVPNHIYKDNCNKCYCQQDQTLRCTQKTCLNYNQATALQQQQQYLQEHGL
ncbi:unnamed protein product [Chrysodeixis includens]|uniref:Pacifastin domain-containing protein n=1 Tax=Chrysodeixis includens TaxID=689277 RepID=A0A9P0FWP4_CHRIL|nr:unnamed protein product [Chrysodeixis includens]